MLKDIRLKPKYTIVWDMTEADIIRAFKWF